MLQNFNYYYYYYYKENPKKLKICGSKGQHSHKDYLFRVSLVQLFKTVFFEKVMVLKMQYEIEIFEKLKCLVKTVKQ